MTARASRKHAARRRKRNDGDTPAPKKPPRRPALQPRTALHEGLRGWGVTWEPVEPGRFRTSGTNVASVILVAHRPEAKQNRRPYR